MDKYSKVFKLLIALKPLLHQGHRLSKDDLKQKNVRLRELLQDFGPTYIKLGQILSVRYDLFHKETCKELQKLLDCGKSIDFKVIEKILQNELGEYMQYFASIEQKPIAVASLGQVHTGILKDGTKVAIKVLKPDVEKNLRSDLNALFTIINITKFLPVLHKLQIREAIAQFEEWTMREIDYSIEATNTEKFKDFFQNEPSIKIPKVYRNCSTDRILVTEFIEGISFKKALEIFQKSSDDIVNVFGIEVSRKGLIEIGKKVIYKQVLKDGFFHADPHPSNVIIIDKNTLSYIDFGMIGKINKHYLNLFKQILFNITSGNKEGVIKGILDLDTDHTDKIKIEEIDKIATEIIDKYENSVTEEYSATSAIFDIAYKTGIKGIKYPIQIIICAKVLATYEGLIQIIDPKINLLNEISPLIEKEKLEIIRKNLDINEVTKKTFRAYNTLINISDKLEKIPENTIDYLDAKTQSINESKENTNNEIVSVKIIAISFIFALSLIIFLYSAIYTQAKILGIPFELFMGLNWIIILIITLYYLLKR